MQAQKYALHLGPHGQNLQLPPRGRCEWLNCKPPVLRYIRGNLISSVAQKFRFVKQTLVEAFMAPRIAALNAAVAAGWLTPEQAEWLRGEMEEHARWLIENTPPMGQFGHGYGEGCH